MATDKELNEHNLVLVEASRIFADRDEHHQGLWKTMDMAEEDHHIQSKSKRWAHTRHEDDALDLINYVVFSILNQRRRSHESG